MLKSASMPLESLRARVRRVNGLDRLCLTEGLECPFVWTAVRQVEDSRLALGLLKGRRMPREWTVPGRLTLWAEVRAP